MYLVLDHIMSVCNVTDLPRVPTIHPLVILVMTADGGMVCFSYLIIFLQYSEKYVNTDLSKAQKNSSFRHKYQTSKCVFIKMCLLMLLMYFSIH